MSDMQNKSGQFVYTEPRKWPKMVDFKEYSYVCCVGTLNLSQKMSDKMKNESGQFNHIELRKRQKCGQSSFLQLEINERAP